MTAGQTSRPAEDPVLEAVRWGADGLVPAVVQDAGDGRVLMLAYVDAEALAATLSTGFVHFHSRSRGRLWRKGETSGNVLRLRELAVDCDGDALLLTADATGPTCHRGTRSCFDEPSQRFSVAQDATTTVEADGPGSRPTVSGQDFAWLEELWTTIVDRAARRPPGSYTTSLLEGGVDAAGRKVTEEATEVLMAAKDDAVAAPDSRAATRSALSGEVADLLYHTLVLLAERGLAPVDVIAVLRARHAR
ncbi:MAG TPA: bifunctional phosphoribosyl-AMP cyclohydrolase/phosphoribosyl-ATP diphosphatase HisIE [Candidatus Saccharimonadales bacterium]|nr:bifunctional phosphoribosyl-AMP cyclohydrolase/phosphoribosyl-ATP diphosphatase HisIE [Candidatus Saccharimonadales bacterium]